MRIAFTKKQSVILIVLLAVLLTATAAVLLVVSCAKGDKTSEPAWTEDAIALSEWSLTEFDAAETEAPDASAVFVADAAHPMPADGAVLQLGEPYTIGGRVYCNYPLTAVTVTITCAHNNKGVYPYKKSIRFKNGPEVYALTDAPDGGTASLAEQVDFSELSVGVHTLTVSAACKGMRTRELFRCRFYVVGAEWETITKESFPDSYPEALKFFGDEKRFMYRYQWVNGRYILADPEWEKTYITQIPGYPDGTLWNVHIDAVPYFEKAFAYLEAARLRVHGTNGDTGILKASDLITEYNGCYVSRFTSSLKAISHHTFGTAVDVNASMEPNKNNDANTKLIDDDVKTHLVYNGILTEDGVSYYDFTYDGAYETDPNGVPQTCVNYLLYELGFYRAGFLWAHYYKSTSDAMHFCLSEFVTYKHDGPMGLQKVFAYAEPEAADTPEPTPEAEQPPEDTAEPDGTPEETANNG